jgi:mono/diheme cytochrome c family protein
MSRSFAIALGLGLSLGMGSALASPEEEKRKQLLEDLDIDTRPKPKPEPPSVEEDEDDAAPATQPDTPEPPSPTEPGAQPDAPAKPRVGYGGRVHKMLSASCASCHKSGGSAGGTRLVLVGEVGADYRAAKRFVTKGEPGKSALLSKAAGKQHGGGAIFAEGSPNYRTLRDWIADGALRSASTPSAPAPPVATPPTTGPKVAPQAKRPRKKSKPKPIAQPDVDAGAPTIEAPVHPPPAESSAPSASAPPRRAFAPEVHAVLVAKCKSCHQPGAPAGGGLALVGDAAVDYETVVRLVDRMNPSHSRLLTKASGREHGGGGVLAAESAEYREVLAWIEDGALGPTAADIPGATATTDEAAATKVDATTGASPRPAPGARLGDGTPLPGQAQARNPLPFDLPFHLRLGGKFDFSYERRNWKNHPFRDEGKHAFQTYHHFLFLSRAGAKDPFGLNVELLTQAFYEFNVRLGRRRKDGARRSKVDYDVLFKAGKIMVPFGPEPLFHKSYGGRSGFDQEILPTIWAQPGIAASLHLRAGPVAIANDLYAVQGYALRSADAILNLQGDVSSIDDFKAAFGDRLAVSWGPLTGWYSLQLNRLGFDRLLTMQAIDLEFYRMPDVPFVKNLVLGVGGMRADVSGGGAGLDYYHFGSYAMVGYYPLSWLYLQYRAGLRTTDNRFGLFYDDRRRDERDRSSHNLTIMGRYKGFYGGVQLFWNLEKANEQDDDFLRVTVGYEF